MNREIKVEGHQPFLLGQIDVKALEKEPYAAWYGPEYKSYSVELGTLSTADNKLQNFKILTFMGTWCGDSRREIPRFIRILDTIKFPRTNLKMVALDVREENFKKSPEGAEWGLDIRRIPTFIFLMNGREVGRIVERPVHSLEADIRQITKREKYVPRYSQDAGSDK